MHSRGVLDGSRYALMRVLVASEFDVVPTDNDMDPLNIKLVTSLPGCADLPQIVRRGHAEERASRRSGP